MCFVMQRREFLKSCFVLMGTGLPAGSFSAAESEAPTDATLSADVAGGRNYVYPAYDVGQIPFSRGGSYLTLSRPVGSRSRLVLSTKRASAVSLKWMKHWANNYFEIAIQQNKRELEYEVEADPWSLKLVTPAGKVSIAFIDDDTLHFHSDGLDIVFVPVIPIDYQFVDSRGTMTIYAFNGFATHQL